MIMAENPGTTDHIYGSGEKSVINNAAGDRKGRPGQPLKANPSYEGGDNDPSTDKIYMDPREKGKKGQAVLTQGPSTMRAAAAPTLVLKSEAELGGIMDMALDQLRDGHAKVIIHVTDAHLQRQLEARLDMAVARERIDKTHRDRIKVGRPVDLLEAAVPEPVTAQAASDDLAAGIDPGAYVRGDLPENAIEQAGLAGTPAMEKEIIGDEPPGQMEKEMIDAASEVASPSMPEDDDEDDMDDLDGEATALTADDLDDGDDLDDLSEPEE